MKALNRSHLPSARGFTLIELLIVVAIIAIVVTALMPAFRALMHMSSNELMNTGVIAAGVIAGLFVLGVAVKVISSIRRNRRYRNNGRRF